MGLRVNYLPYLTIVELTFQTGTNTLAYYKCEGVKALGPKKLGRLSRTRRNSQAYSCRTHFLFQSQGQLTIPFNY